jgi:hypothetical protein
MVSEADVRRAASELERRAQNAENQLRINTARLEKLVEILRSKDILTQLEATSITRGIA